MHVIDTRSTVMRKGLAALAAAGLIAGAAAGPATAAAKPVAYKGKTKAGHGIAFKRAGDTITGLGSYVPVYCVSSRTGDTMSGADSFTPPGRLRMGAERTVSAKQPTAIGMSSTATKNYRLTITRGPRGKVKGKLHLNFMIFEPYYNAWGYLDANTYVCQGDTSFTARPAAPRRRG